MATDLEAHRLNSIVPSMYYIPNFITPSEATTILSAIPSNRWITLSKRRLQTHPAQLTASNTLISSSPLRKFLLEPAVKRIHELGVFEGAPHGINHCLINEYLPGQGIMPHEDGDAYHPVVATVSLGANIVLEVMEKKTQDNGGKRRTWKILQEPGSLLLTTGMAYTETLHGIAEVEVDEGLEAGSVANWELLSEEARKVVEGNGGTNLRAERISLTFRDVKKVSKLGNKIFGKPRT